MAAGSIEKPSNNFSNGSSRHGLNTIVKPSEDAASFLFAALTFSRILYSIVLLNAVVNWNDERWTFLHVLALIPALWAAISTLVAVAGLLRWKIGGRIATMIDMIICGVAIATFPAYVLPSLALSALSCTTLVLRHDGRFAGTIAILPFAAILVRPLGVAFPNQFNWPVSSLNMGAAGDIVAFVLSALVIIFAMQIMFHVRRVERPLVFRQPLAGDINEGLSQKDFEPVIERIEELYPRGKTICIFNSRTNSQGFSIVTNPNLENSEIRAQQSQLVSNIDDGLPPSIFELEEEYCIDLSSGTKSPVPDQLTQLARALKSLGYSSGVLIDFQYGIVPGRLFFSTGAPIGEATRMDASVLADGVSRFFEDATEWDNRREKMIALARDLARRDLHDGILQSLAALKMRLVTLIAGPSFANHPDAESLRKTVDIITVEQSRLRALLNNDEDMEGAINLVETVEVCLQILELQWEVELKLDSQEPALPVDQESAENIEYLVREAVANAIRHAGAKQLSIALALNKGSLIMTVKNDQLDGAKTDMASAARSILDSRSLQQRLALVNGNAYSEKLEAGTLLAMRIPMDFTANA